MHNYTKLAFHVVDASNLNVIKNAKTPAAIAAKMMRTPGSGLRNIAEAAAKKHVPLPPLSELRKQVMQTPAAIAGKMMQPAGSDLINIAAEMMQTPGSGLRNIAEAAAKTPAAIAGKMMQPAGSDLINIAAKMMQTPGSGLRNIAEAAAKKHVPLPAAQKSEAISAPISNLMNNLFNRYTATAAVGGAGLGGVLEHLRANYNAD